MAFFKPIYKKLSKKWHPQAVSVGKPIEMDELCKQIALISTVSSADTKATLEALGLVLGTCMNTGRTVHVEGLGTFYYTCISTGKGVDTAEKVNANQISGTRVRFVPESHRQGTTITRGLIGENVTWANINSISQLDRQLFAVVLFRNELILRGYFVRVHLFFVPLAYQTSKRNMGIEHFITKEKNYEKLQNHQ